MRTLENIVIFEDTLKSDILYADLCIEYNDWKTIHESLGIPNDLEYDANYIAVKTKRLSRQFGYHDFNYVISRKDLKLDIYDKINISVKFTERNYAEITNHEDKPKICDLIIEIDKDNIDDIYGLIGHELLHGYIFSTNYKNCKSSFKNRLEKISYNNIFDLSNVDEEIYAKTIVYYTNTDELNAFIAQIMLDIQNAKPKTPKEAYSLLYDNDIYKLYQFSLTDILKSKDVNLPLLCEEIRKLVKDWSDLSDTKILENLRKRISYIKKRLIKIIPRECARFKDFIIKEWRKEHFDKFYSTLYDNKE